MKWCDHTGSRLRIALITHSSDLPGEWAQLVPQDHFLGRDQLAINEQANLPGIQHYYALVFYKGKVAAAAFFQVLSLRKEHVSREGINSALYYAWRAYTTLCRPSLLVAGHLFRHDISSFYAAPHLSAYESYLCYREAIEAVRSESCSLAALIKDLPQPLINYFLQYAPQYVMLRNDISMELPVAEDWTSFEDYEHALKHKYAQRTRKIRSAWNHLTVRELSDEDLELHKERIFHLYKQTADHQQVRLGYLSPDFIIVLRRYYGKRLVVRAVYDGDTMVAFLSAWVHEEDFDMFYIGFDYDRNADLQLYFNILYYSLELAITLQKKKLILGRTALDAKARLGCRPRYLHTFLFVKNRLLRNYVIRAQQRLLTEESSWEEKHPFKK